MSSQTAYLISPPHPLAARVCDVDGGLTFEEVLAWSDAIVRRTAAQWRFGVMMDVEWLSEVLDRAHRDPPGPGPVPAAIVARIRTIADDASTLGLAAVQRAATALCDRLADLDAGGFDPADRRHRLARAEQAMMALQAELGEPAHDQGTRPGVGLTI